MQFKQIYSLEEQQVIADDVMSACNRKPLAKYNIKQRSVARNLNALGKETSGRAGMRYGVYPFIYTEPYVEEGHVAATFALDTRQHLMTSQEFATKLFNELKSITKMIYTLGKNQTKEEIRHIDSIMLDPIRLSLPSLLLVRPNERDRETKCNLIFTKYELTKVRISFRGQIPQVCIDWDSFKPVQMHEIFLNSGIVRAYCFDEAGNLRSVKRDLKISEPLDFIRSTHNIIEHAKTLQKIQDFWRESITYQENDGPFSETRTKRTITYTVILQNLNLKRSEILTTYWKRLSRVTDLVNIAKFTTFELGVFNDLSTKITVKELDRVINWYRQNKSTIFIDSDSSSFELYRQYILARFSKNATTPIDSTTKWRFYRSFQDYYRFYRQIMHKKIQIDYYSIDRFFAEELTVAQKYKIKQTRNYNKPFTVNTKWDRLKYNIKNDKRIILLDTPLKLVNEGTAQHNCVGTYTDVGRKEHSAFLEFTYAGLIHTVQVDYNKENDDYLIVQMYSSMNQPNATGAEEELQKIINKK